MFRLFFGYFLIVFCAVILISTLEEKNFQLSFLGFFSVSSCLLLDSVLCGYLDFHFGRKNFQLSFLGFFSVSSCLLLDSVLCGYLDFHFGRKNIFNFRFWVSFLFLLVYFLIVFCAVILISTLEEKNFQLSFLGFFSVSSCLLLDSVLCGYLDFHFGRKKFSTFVFGFLFCFFLFTS